MSWATYYQLLSKIRFESIVAYPFCYRMLELGVVKIGYGW
jgi:hypothetical protein